MADLTSVYGNILVPSQLEKAAIDTLIKWMPSYLSEIERQIGISKDSLSVPTNYTNRNSFDVIVGEELPKVVVISPGTVGTPVKNGLSAYRVPWRLGVGVAISARDEIIANMMAKCYGAAVRAIMVQPRQAGYLEGFPGIRGIDWVGESYDDLPIQDQLSLFKTASVLFTIDIDNIVTKRAGPVTPSSGPVYHGQVEEVIIDLEKEAIL